jgi:D-aminopeptidase
MQPGPRNLITDVRGLLVGNAEEHRLKSGTTVLVSDRPFVASVDIMGGCPGTRETELLASDKLVSAVDAIVLSGGSAQGLDAASGVADALLRRGRGYRVENVVVPIVPAAILFDLLNGGDKYWDINPYRSLGEQALASASTDFDIGTAGAGTGAFTAQLKGGLGSASLVLSNGTTVGALVVANPVGSVTAGDNPHFWAAPFEAGAEFGGLGAHAERLSYAQSARTKTDVSPIAATTLVIVATDAELTKPELKRMAIAAQDGIARGVSPAHTLLDGDLVFSISTSERRVDGEVDLLHLGHAASVCVARAIARAIYCASPAPSDRFPTWKQKWAS